MAKVTARRRKIGNFIGGLLVMGFGYYNLIFYAPAMVNIIQDLSRKRIEWCTENLQLNDNDIVALVTKKSEREGLKDIDEIINTSPYEEAWLHIPILKEWYEIGIYRGTVVDEWGLYNNWGGEDLSYVDRVLERIKIRTSATIKDIFFYHNHSKKQVIISKNTGNILKGNYVQKKNILNDKRQLLTTKILEIVFKGYERASPKTDDIESMIKKTFNYQKNFPEMDIKCKLRSQYGTTEWFLTDEGISHFKSTQRYEDILRTGAGAKYDKEGIHLHSRHMDINFYPKEAVFEEKTLTFKIKK